MAQPGQRRHAEVAVVDDQIIDPRQFGMTQAFDNERRRGFAGACPAGEARKFERVCRWKNEAFLLRSAEHTSELQSLMRISYAVLCLKQKSHANTRHIQGLAPTTLKHPSAPQ